MEEERPFVNSMDEDNLEEIAPPQIEEFLSTLGLGDKTYTCTLKGWPVEGGGLPSVLEVTKNRYPDIGDVGVKYGPGKYTWAFSWKAPKPGPGGGYKNVMRDTTHILGESWEEAHEEYLYKRHIDRKKRMEQMKREQEVKGIVDNAGPPKSGEDSFDKATEQLERVMATFKRIGLPMGNTPQGGGDSSQFMTMMMGFMAEMNKTALNVQQQNTANLMQMFGLMMKNQQPQDSAGIMQEVIGMVRQAVNLKEVLNPQKEGLVDKVFSMLEGVAPHILSLARKPEAARQSDPLLQMAANSEEFRELKNDPVMLQALCERWDAHYGAKQTNDILAVAGMSRPGGMPDPMEQFDNDGGAVQETASGESKDLGSQPVEYGEDELEVD